jgi:single-stranded-DNA-specific exonuclease
MNYKLIQEPNSINSGLEQVLVNRGIPRQKIQHWLNTTDKDINDFKLLGEDNLKRAARALITAISANKRALVVVDCDADGFCSSAILINYLYDHFPAWVQNNLDWFIHSGKQHGLSDVDVDSTAEKYALVLCPDASSEDYEYHLAFVNKGVDIVILDHHEAKISSPNAIVVNNQLSAYPNKSFCGAGVTWQFCRYLDSLMGTRYAENYIDLVALGLVSDMMSLREIETKHLIFKGFDQKNIHNPFIAEMMRKQEYSMAKRSLPNGIAWYITPFVNAMVRSGEEQEKEILFKSFLKFKAFDIVLSDKRGHRPGETEQLVTQALRVADRVKKRQGDAQDKAMAILENMIEEQDLLAHKVLLFLLEPGTVERTIAGLAANKIMGKYQRPCAVLTRCEREEENYNMKTLYTTYEGSARGCDATGINEFKDICENTGVIEYVAGHQGAFGLGLLDSQIPNFLAATDDALKDTPDDRFYYVDYLYHNTLVNEEQLLDICNLSNLYGKDINESYVAVERLHITSDMVQVYVKKNNTLKITLPNKVTIMFFDAPDELCDKLQNTKGFVEMNIVGQPKRNEYNGWVTAQIFVEDYEITGESRFNF